MESENNIVDISKRDIAKLISNVENNKFDCLQDIRRQYFKKGHAFIIGITGPPGVGKSTLINRLITEFRRENLRVALLAVDPSSNITGGAILGDRLRMTRHILDEDVFTRSVATRGHLGGLSKIVPEAIQILDVGGYDIILVETIGVGQDEIEVSNFVHTVVLVLVPGMGDEIQAVKSGIMEIANILVFNKADRFEIGKHNDEFTVMGISNYSDAPKQKYKKLFKTSAKDGTGVKELVEEILNHRALFVDTGEFKRKKNDQLRVFFDSILKEAVTKKIMGLIIKDASYSEVLAEILQGKLDTYSAAEKLIKEHLFFEL